MEVLRRLAINLLKYLLEMLEPQMSPPSPQDEVYIQNTSVVPKEYFPETIMPEVVIFSNRSLVNIPSSSENPRPLRGRELYREQLHFARCCKIHGCIYNDDNCPVKETNIISYFKECCIINGS